MSPVPGYHGQYLRVDLSNGTSTCVPWPEGVLRNFLGGVGLGTWLLHQETPGRVDALAPESPLVFVFSPLVGSPLTTSAKFAVLAKSPLTGRINDSLSSSSFAIAGKRTGHDAIVITGASPEPISLVVTPEGVAWETARSEWGQSSRSAAEALESRLGADGSDERFGGFQVAAIGPAGERLVRYATISHDARHAGRGGLGAVMGSKRLKAVAVAGDRQVAFSDPDRLVAMSRELSRQSLGPATAKYRELGTVDNLVTFNRLGTLPTRNFQAGEFEGAERLAPDALATDRDRTRASCAACTIGCEHIFAVTGADGNEAGVRMEYENLFALGPLCGVSDPEIVLQASRRCDELGLDTISTGASVAFAMECAERGLVDLPELRFGDGAAMLSMIDDIGHRREAGDMLAEGTRIVAERIGGDAPGLAPHVKGLELPGYEPRVLQAMALGFAVNPRGADHNRSGAYEVDFAPDTQGMDSIGPVVRVEDEAVLMDSLILCKFLRGVFEDRASGMAGLLGPVTGWDVTAEELLETAGRIVTAKKAYNIGQGWTPDEDTLPQRFLDEPLKQEGQPARELDADRLAAQVKAYNEFRGWTSEGFVPADRLVEIGLSGSPAMA